MFGRELPGLARIMPSRQTTVFLIPSACKKCTSYCLHPPKDVNWARRLTGTCAYVVGARDAHGVMVSWIGYS